MSNAETTRVTMLWPTDLKEAVRAKVGQRGLTNFTVEAVREHLNSSVSTEAKGLDKEVGELRFLVQVLADHLVLGGTHQDRREALMEVELPHWIQTNGWPGDMAELVKSEILEPVAPPEPEPEPEPESDPEPEVGSGSDEDLHKPMFLTGKKEEPSEEAAPEAPAPVDLPHDRQGGDLLSRIQAKAMEKGVDLDPAKLRPASEVPQPATKPAPELEVQAEAPSEVAPEPARATPPPPRAEEPESAPANPNACPKCSMELVDGECWSCF